MICLDACIIGHVLAPDESLVSADEIRASGRLVKKISIGQVTCCAPTVLIAEIKYLAGRIAKTRKRADFLVRADEVEDLLPQVFGSSFRFIDVDFAIAALAADYRLENYSKQNAFSYNDGVYLATAQIKGCDALVTTDKHLLSCADIPVFTPSAYINQKEK